MKVSELIRLLEQLDDHDAEVYFAYPRGDFWRTTVAKAVEVVSDGVRLEWSNYHIMYTVLSRDDDDRDPNTDDVIGVVLE